MLDEPDVSSDSVYIKWMNQKRKKKNIYIYTNGWNILLRIVYSALFLQVTSRICKKYRMSTWHSVESSVGQYFTGNKK